MTTSKHSMVSSLICCFLLLDEEEALPLDNHPLHTSTSELHGDFQPLDIRFHCIFKLSLKQSYHMCKDLVDNFLVRIEVGDYILINVLKLIKKLHNGAGIYV